MAQILPIPQKSNVGMDPGKVQDLEASLGADRCREVIADACFQIVEKLTVFELAMAAGSAEQAATLARRIAAVAEEVGMLELGHAARAAAECQRGADPVARMATGQRLLRVGTVSLERLYDSTGY
ncbi:MAG: hypothetical protein AAGE76_02570 [Pseudomonadota bacterium]